MSYFVWCPELGQTLADTYPIDSDDSDGAVRAWAEDYDHDNQITNPIADNPNSRLTVFVVRDNAAAERKQVWGSYAPRYHTIDVPPSRCGDRLTTDELLEELRGRLNLKRPEAQELMRLAEEELL